ncbi:MAG: CARDB domain-containing protein [Patescibacteria group bacterium]
MKRHLKRLMFLVFVGVIGAAFLLSAASPVLAAPKKVRLPYANGVLLKSKVTKRIYLIKDSKKQYIGSLADLKKLGKKKTYLVADKILALYANYVNPVKAESINIKEVKAAFERYRQINKNKDCTSTSALVTKKTLAWWENLKGSLDGLFSSSTIGTTSSSTFFSVQRASSTSSTSCVFYKDLVLVKAEEKYGEVSLTYNQIHFNGLPEQTEVLFLKEDGMWKIGIAEALEKDAQETKDCKLIPGEPANGLPDFIVTKAELYPNPGKVNSDDTELNITIKNIGNKTYNSFGCGSVSTTLLSISAEVVGSKYIPTSMQLAEKIAPGESITSDAKLFNQWFNEHFPESLKVDEPGKKIIKITLNKYNDVKESNTKNNIFTKEFNFVQ